MRKHKSHPTKRDLLCEELLVALEREYTPVNVQKLPWMLLDRLVDDCNLLTPILKRLVKDATAKQSAIDYLRLQEYSDPQMYRSAAEYYAAASVLSFLKKYPFGKVEGVDPLTTAQSKVRVAETLCALTNKRLKYFRRNDQRLYKKRRDVYQILHLAREQIGRILGPLDLNTIYDYCRHGPGGSLGVTGDMTTAYFKFMLSPYTVSPRALPYAEAAILADPLWRRMVVNQCSIIGDPCPTVQEARSTVLEQLKVVDYNKVTYVPKTALTHRAIAVEPTMNVFLQLGVGDYMTVLLRRAGTNILSQARNQSLARDGSIWNSSSETCPVTLDMSMASDTVSYELVKLLLPEEWFELLDNLRSHNGMEDRVVRPWSKFSSMGNGFTFQLETMIFKALAESVAKHTGLSRRSVSIYGDDIICPRGMALLLIEVLNFCGFRLNTEKSFLFGPFRESCGEDWFEGQDVRPFFLKREIQNARDLVFVLNSFGGLYGLNWPADRSLDDSSLPDGVETLERFRLYCYGRLPKLVRRHLHGPRTEALEGHIHTPWDLAQKSSLVLWDVNFQSWSYASVIDRPLEHRGRPGPLYLQLMDSQRLDAVPVNPVWRVVPPLEHLEWVKYVDLRRSLALGFTYGDGSGPNQVCVVMRNRTMCAVTTLTSDGWRNDDH